MSFCKILVRCLFADMPIRRLIFLALLFPAFTLQLSIDKRDNGQNMCPANPIPRARDSDNIYTLPGCEIWGSFDCLVAKTAFRMPSYCKTLATTVNCVIYLAPAFCGDIFVENAKDYIPTVQHCLDLIPLGPCVCSNGGRACRSDLFLRFPFYQDINPPRVTVTTGAPGQLFDLQMDSLDVVFGGVLDPTWRWLDDGPGNNDVSRYVWGVGQVLLGTLYLVLYFPLESPLILI
jgi:hypothetical protein